MMPVVAADEHLLPAEEADERSKLKPSMGATVEKPSTIGLLV